MERGSSGGAERMQRAHLAFDCRPGAVLANAVHPPVSLARTAPRRAQLLALIVPLLATFAVWLPLRGNYFNGDDFVHFYDFVTRPLSSLLGQVWGGHLLVLYNVAFWTMFQLFGTDPRGYAWTVILTHLLNTFLVYQVIRPHGLVLAGFGALLWGTCPVLVGALGWYSVYGQVLLTTLVLSVLWSLERVRRSGAPLSPATAMVWVVVLAAGATSFGTGLGVAAAFPVAVALALPVSQLPRRSLLVLAVGAIATLVGYELAVAYSPDISPATRVLLADSRQMPGLVALSVHLLGFGASALLFDPLGAHERFPDWTQMATVAVVAILLLAAGASSDTAGRRRLAALCVLVAAAYGAIAGGRSAIYAAASIPFATVAKATRYHYLPLALLVLLMCASLAEIERRHRVAGRIVSGAAILWMVVRLVVLAVSPFTIELGDQRRADVAEVFRTIEAQAERTPPGDAVLIQNRPFGVSVYFPDSLPGWAGVFVVFSPENSVDGRPVRFAVDEGDWQRAHARGGRIAELVVRR